MANLLSGITALYKGLRRQVFQWPTVIAATLPSDDITLLKTDADGNLCINLASSYQAGAGSKGSVYIDDTEEHAGPFVEIRGLADAVAATMTSSDIEGTLTDVPIPAGGTIPGTITSITLTSGKVIAIKG